MGTVKRVNKVDPAPRVGFPMEMLDSEEWHKLLFGFGKIDEVADVIALVDCLSTQAEEAIVLADLLDSGTETVRPRTGPWE